MNSETTSGRRGKRAVPKVARLFDWLHSGRVTSPDEQQDERVRAAVAGDADALEGLLSENTDWLASKLSIAPRWSRAIAREDVVQVTFVEAYLRIRTLRDATYAAFKVWLLRIAENNLRDAVRSLGRDKRPESRTRLTHGPEGESSRTLLARMKSDDPSMGTRLGDQEEVTRMLAAIDELPASYGAVIRALDLDERSVAEFADEVGRSHGAVHMLHSRAIDRLRELLLRTPPPQS